MASSKVFITGASSGLGAALARAYAREGATVGLLARRREALDALAKSLSSPRQVYVADVNDAAALRNAALAYMREFDCPDVVIANAGVSHGTVTEIQEDLAVFETIVRTNLIATVATFQPFLEAMKARRHGTLVTIASVAGIRGLPGAGAYSASKAAVIAYSESLRLEMAQYGVKVVTIAPGYIDTPMTEGNPYPMPFMISAEEFARRALRVIARGKPFAVIPWPMAIVARVLRWMPIRLYDRLFARAPRKPRYEILPGPRTQLPPRLEETAATFGQQTLDFGIDLAADQVPESGAPAASPSNGRHVAVTAEPPDVPAGVTVWRGRAQWPSEQ
jgi:short-subunit dehydrogenase